MSCGKSPVNDSEIVKNVVITSELLVVTSIETLEIDKVKAIGRWDQKDCRKWHNF